QYKATATQIMIQRATLRGMITYSEVADKLNAAHPGVDFEPHDQRLWELLGDAARDEANAGRGILSVVVVHKHGDMEPGNGFYELAKYYKRNLSDKQKCFLEELHRVHEQWS
ncbi:MAG: hypothetical protein JWM68_4552, partial [Verrucomicrobiales bacterium]|nr:hypothetical protein [Verrucomicrobiales bacterium]